MKSSALAAMMISGLIFAVDDSKDQPTRPAVGDPAPKIRLNDHEGDAVSIGGEGDTWTVLAFYPKAMTSGCTREVCSLRDAVDQFDEMDVEVFGISLDDVASQADFVEREELNFLLLSDPDGSAAAKYDVLHESKAFTTRVTFVIDPKGIVRFVDTSVAVAKHGTDLVTKIRELQKE